MGPRATRKGQAFTRHLRPETTSTPTLNNPLQGSPRFSTLDAELATWEGWQPPARSRAPRARGTLCPGPVLPHRDHPLGPHRHNTPNQETLWPSGSPGEPSWGTAGPHGEGVPRGLLRRPVAKPLRKLRTAASSWEPFPAAGQQEAPGAPHGDEAHTCHSLTAPPGPPAGAGQEAEKQGGPYSPRTTPRGADTGVLPASPGTAWPPGRYGPRSRGRGHSDGARPPVLCACVFICTAGNTTAFLHLFMTAVRSQPPALA